jgi:protein-disulfide isomerase
MGASAGFIKPKYLILTVVCGFVIVGWTAYENSKRVQVADVDGEAIYVADFEKSAGRALFQQRELLYQLEKQKLDEYINAVVLTREARKSGFSVAAILDREVNSKIMPVTDAEIEVFYSSNKSRIGADLEQSREQIREFLRDKKIEAQKALYLRSLRSNAKIKTYLTPPPPFRVEVPIVNAPSRGPADAPVTIVSFEDYQCPFCKQVQPIFAELLSRYVGKLRWVHKDFPLDLIHPQARQAAEGGRCADEQGKFWLYHDTLYANSPKISQENLKNFAKMAGLDVNAFERCMITRRSTFLIQRDITDATQLGVTGTPTVFINGREIAGNHSLETFEAMIDEEFAALK